MAGNGNSFWSDPALDPKRQYRFQVNFGNLHADPFIAKTAKKPSYQVGVSKHQYLSHEFKYPTTVKWNDVTITIVDPGSPDMTKTLMAVLGQAGYVYPNTVNAVNTVSKLKYVGAGSDRPGAIGSITIEQIDSEGNAIERWTLKNPFISNVEFGQLSYASEDMVEITMTIVYDWAEITGNIGGNTTNGQPLPQGK